MDSILMSPYSQVLEFLLEGSITVKNRPISLGIWAIWRDSLTMLESSWELVWPENTLLRISMNFRMKVGVGEYLQSSPSYRGIRYMISLKTDMIFDRSWDYKASINTKIIFNSFLISRFSSLESFPMTSSRIMSIIVSYISTDMSLGSNFFSFRTWFKMKEISLVGSLSSVPFETSSAMICLAPCLSCSIISLYIPWANSLVMPTFSSSSIMVF